MASSEQAHMEYTFLWRRRQQTHEHMNNKCLTYYPLNSGKCSEKSNGSGNKI